MRATEGLTSFREELNDLDERIVDLVAKRIAICREVARYKREHGIPMMQSARVQQVKDRCADQAAEQSVDPGFMRKLYSVIIDETCRIEDEIIKNGR
jgi:chorismate mutase